MNTLSNIQEKTAFLPDYSFKSQSDNEEEWPAVSVGTSISGIIGGALTLGLALLIGFGVKFNKREKEKKLMFIKL